MSIDVRREHGLPAVSTGRLATTWELDLDYVPCARFASLVFERALPHTSARTWSTERMTLDGVFPYAIASFRDRTERTAVLDLGEIVDCACLVYLSLEFDTAYLRVASDRVDALADAEAWVRERYPETNPEERQSVPITFWSQGHKRSARTIEVPSWPEVRSNYPRAVAARLDPLMHPEFRPDSGGQLVLWHGEPGTGKTSALRALAWQWHEWCRVHYVTDPETFFGTTPKYMLDVLLDEEEDDLWRLLVLEDTGELIAADAKRQSGQGLSRLLNVVDGLIGQGLRVLVLVTTNEPLGRLHPAVSRPGRCAAAVEFAAFSGDEAAAWLDRNESDARPAAGTLADLYARKAGVELPVKQRVGF